MNRKRGNRNKEFTWRAEKVGGLKGETGGIRKKERKEGHVREEQRMDGRERERRFRQGKERDSKKARHHE